jgi:hypothetical protein
MIESVYITLIVISFAMFVVSIFGEKYLSKFICCFISSLIFTFLAYSSTTVQIMNCTSSSCSQFPFFYNDLVWFFYGMAAVSGLLTFIFILLFSVSFNTPGPQQEENL